MQPGSQLSINAVEGFPLEEFSADVCPVIDSLSCSNITKTADVAGRAIPDNRSTEDRWRQRE